MCLLRICKLAGSCRSSRVWSNCCKTLALMPGSPSLLHKHGIVSIHSICRDPAAKAQDTVSWASSVNARVPNCVSDQSIDACNPRRRACMVVVSNAEKSTSTSSNSPGLRPNSLSDPHHLVRRIPLPGGPRSAAVCAARIDGKRVAPGCKLQTLQQTLHPCNIVNSEK